MKKMLIVTKKPLVKSPRVMKQIKAMKESLEISTIGIVPSGYEKHFYAYKKLKIFEQIIRLPLLKLRLYEQYYWDKNKLSMVAILKSNHYDIIIAHNEELLPLALKIAKGSKVILDAHEYAPDADSSFVWRLFLKGYFTYLCKNYLKQVNAMISVSEGISNLYFEKYGVTSLVISNSAKFYNISPQPVNGRIKLIHHGFAHPGRELELMIETMKYLGNKYTLDLMLDKRLNTKYFRKIEKKARKYANVRIVEPVPYEEIIQTINKYDIGIYILKPFCLSAKYALPNKIFEFIQARLAVAIGPSAEMGKIVSRYDIGVISPDYSPKSMSVTISKLTKKRIMYCKNQSHKYAKELSSESDIERIKELVENQLSNQSGIIL